MTDLFNGVLRANGVSHTLATSIDNVITHFQRRNLPFHRNVGPTSQPANIGDLLTSRGVHHAEDEPGIAVDLDTLNENLPHSVEIVIQRVTTYEQLVLWTQVWGCGAPDDVTNMVLSVYSQLPLDSHSSVHYNSFSARSMMSQLPHPHFSSVLVSPPFITSSHCHR